MKSPRLLIIISGCVLLLAACDKKEAKLPALPPLAVSDNPYLEKCDLKTIPVVSLIAARGILLDGKPAGLKRLKQAFNPSLNRGSHIALACAPDASFHSFFDLLDKMGESGIGDFSLLVNGSGQSADAYRYRFPMSDLSYKFPWMKYSGPLPSEEFKKLKEGNMVTLASGSACVVLLRIDGHDQFTLFNKSYPAAEMLAEIAALRAQYSPMILYLTARDDVKYAEVIHFLDLIQARPDTPCVFVRVEEDNGPSSTHETQSGHSSD